MSDTENEREDMVKMQNRYSRYLIDAGLDWEVDGNTV